MIELDMMQKEMSLDEMITHQLRQNYDLDFILADRLDKESFDAMQSFILDISALYKSMHVCSIIGKQDELKVLSDIFTEKVTKYVEIWIPQMLKYCKDKTAAHNKKMN